MTSFVLVILTLMTRAAPAAEIAVAAIPGGLVLALSQAQDGDRLVLAPGIHAGPIIIAHAIDLAGMPGAVIKGDGKGTVVTIDAPDVTVQGITVTGSGLTLATQDSGIFVTPNGDRAVVEHNHIDDNLIGIYLSGPDDAVVRDNDVTGRQDLRVNERGNGIQLWNTPGSQVIGNRVSQGRDGIFVTTSRENLFADNVFRNVRFAIHYMYTNYSEIRGNRSYDNTVGYALMYSDHLRVTDNLSSGDQQHGIMLNYANASEFIGNAVENGGAKCVFIYNSNKNDFRGNRFEGCDIGVHFTAGSERNVIVDNAFVGNRTQVKYVGTRWLEWSENGRGNYWSDNAAFDLDGNGIGDRPYRPNDMLDQVVWAHPSARLLISSPAFQILKWAQSRFPALHPGGVVDSAPLMTPPDLSIFHGEIQHAG
ncbi:nitrous oxide reductase family maturation protein NosD [Thalassospira mesophila]|uniref:Carbohydrate-binding protein n=1 Tax=Thalassospira mesophila TaxID=1293891 RepID=A0A1Y2KWK2_9PROT|nr:nitrous oxide reductase family maturation protein NosD [Thalassospira mesophila]OSQ36031.1 carbohydrate-binding protein [Thalassospira mesophila]